MKDKGISPLIAAVILIAFVIAVAGVASGFFTDFIQRTTGEVSDRGQEAVDCTTADFEIDLATVGDGDNSVTVHNTGSQELSNWTYTVYGDSTDSGSTNQASVSGESVQVNYSDSSVTGMYRIRISTEECSQKTSIVNETETGEWDYVY